MTGSRPGLSRLSAGPLPALPFADTDCSPDDNNRIDYSAADG